MQAHTHTHTHKETAARSGKDVRGCKINSENIGKVAGRNV